MYTHTYTHTHTCTIKLCKGNSEVQHHEGYVMKHFLIFWRMKVFKYAQGITHVHFIMKLILLVCESLNFMQIFKL